MALIELSIKAPVLIDGGLVVENKGTGNVFFMHKIPLIIFDPPPYSMI